MSRSIDERIVQMTFNNKDFENKASQTISTLGKLGESLMFKDADKGIANLQGSLSKLNFDNLGYALESTKTKFSAWQVACSAAITKVTQQAVEAGERLVKSLSIDQVNAGWTKYNQKTASVQTLVNSTGKSVEEIEGYLEKLMKFSDETSFGFTDMTSSLATMVSTGGDIDKLIPMIEGIANATAFAGKGASEFSRAIYNLNQSYSAGSLQYMDWKSLQGAGVNSKALTEELIKAGEELGKISKGSITLENFTDSLKDKWADTEVMEKAFGRFSAMTEAAQKAVAEGQYDTFTEAYEELAKSGAFDDLQIKAAKSAQEAKSLAEAIDATKDAVSSGWMSIFDAIFGDYNESKALWSRMSEDLWEIFASGFKDKVKFLNIWHDMWEVPEDAEEPITQLEAVWKEFANVIITVRDIISDLFKKTFPMSEDMEGNAKKLFNFIEKIRKSLINIGSWLNGDIVRSSGVLTSSVSNLEKIITGIFRTIKFIKTTVSTFIDSFVKPLITLLEPSLIVIENIIGNIGKTLTVTSIRGEAKISSFADFLKKILDTIKPLINIIKEILMWFEKLSENLLNKAKGSTISKKDNDFSLLTVIFDTLRKALEKIYLVIQGTLPTFDKLKETFTKIIDKIKEFISKIRDGLSEAFGSLSSNSEGISKLASGGILGYLAIMLGKALKSIINLTKDGKINLNFFSGIKDAISDLVDTFTKLKKAKIDIEFVSTIGKAVLMIAGSLFVLSMVNPEKLAVSAGALGGSLLAIFEFIKNISKMDPTANMTAVQKVSKAIGKIAFALLVLSIALKIMSTMDLPGMGIALFSLGMTLVFVGTFINALKDTDKKVKADKIESIGKTMKGIGIGLIAIAIAMKLLATLNMDQIKVGLLAIGGVLIELMTFIFVLSKLKGIGPVKFESIGIMMMALTLSLIEISIALKILSTIDLPSIGIALLGLLGTLAIIFAFTAGISSKAVGSLNFTAIATAMLTLAPALILLAAALKILASIDAGQMVVAVNALMQTLFIISLLGAALSLTGAVGGFALFATSMLIMGPAMILMAAGLKALSKVDNKQLGQGLKVLAAGMATIGVVGGILGIISPLFLLFSVALMAFGAAIALVGAGLIKIIPALAAFQLLGKDISLSLTEMFTTVFSSILSLIPSFILGILDTIVSFSATLIEIIVKLIVVICDALIKAVPKVIETIKIIILAIIEGLRIFVYDFAGGIILLIIDIINAVANAFRDNSEGLGEAIGNLVEAVIEGVVKMLKGAAGSFWDGLTSWFSGDNDTETNDMAKKTGNVLTGSVQEGIMEKGDDLKDSTEGLLTDTAEDVQTTNVLQAFASTGDFSVEGMLSGILSNENKAKMLDAGGQLFDWELEGYQSRGVIASPSKVMIEQGKFTVMGLLKGITSNETEIKKSGSALFDSISKALNLSNMILEDEFTSPVITPVLDLSEIQNGASNINGIFSDLTVPGVLLGNIGNYGFNSPLGTNNTNNITLNASFNVNGNLDESSAMEFADMITERINENLYYQIN